MKWPWFIPVWFLIGVWGTRLAWKERHSLGGVTGSWSWVWLLLVAWMPLLCWAIAQFVVQD